VIATRSKRQAVGEPRTARAGGGDPALPIDQRRGAADFRSSIADLDETISARSAMRSISGASKVRSRIR
jgi:hypothetical protein